MKNYYHEMPDGYRETIEKGMNAVRNWRIRFSHGSGSIDDNIRQLKKEIETADAIVVGAGAGLSTSAGLTYSGERFRKYFFDFAKTYGIQDMYSGGFFPFPDDETRWAWWARHIYYNRYVDAPRPVYAKLFDLRSSCVTYVTTYSSGIWRAGVQVNVRTCSSRGVSSISSREDTDADNVMVSSFSRNQELSYSS